MTSLPLNNNNMFLLVDGGADIAGHGHNIELCSNSIALGLHLMALLLFAAGFFQNGA